MVTAQVSLGHGDLFGLANVDDSTFLTIRAGGQASEEARMVVVRVSNHKHAVALQIRS